MNRQTFVYLSTLIRVLILPLLRNNLRQHGLLIALTLSTFLLYLTTLAPSIVTLFDDSLEFQLVAYQLGIAHPTGYPLYTMLGYLFTLLPIGNVAFRVNLMSAVFGAATVGLLYHFILTITPSVKMKPPSSIWPHQIGSAITTFLFALSPIFWQQATIAEVYTLNAFFVILILLVTVWATQHGLSWSRLGWLALLGGLSLTHHRTMALIVPATVSYVGLTCWPSLKRMPLPRLAVETVKLILLGCVPLLLYLYLPLRGHVGSLDGTYRNSWGGFWQQVTASGYSNTFLLDNPFNQQRDLSFYTQLLTDQFGLLTLLGFAGAYLLWRAKQYSIFLLTSLTLLAYTLFNLFYNVADIEVFFIPVFLIWITWIGLALSSGLVYLHRRYHQRKQPVWLALLVVMLILLTMQLGYASNQHQQPIQARNSWQIHDYGLDMLQQSLPQGATIIGIVGEMTLLRYFQQTEGFRPDLITVSADLEADRFQAIEQSLADGRAVFLTRELLGAVDKWSLSAVGPLIQVNPTPITDIPLVTHPLEQTVMPEINLCGYTFSRPSHTAEGMPPLRLSVVWQATAPMPTDLKVSARLLDSAGELVAVVDQIPVHFAYPTTAWRAGEFVTDVYDWQLPPDLPAGEYQPLIIWYDPAQNAAEVGRVHLPVTTIN
ncbi:DUF2723 domain-containing protein [Anaerolineales bacterium HSG6]|nr:DUF2723 domain-containing protein [Anaerolineales bacterium HSG6]